MIKETIRGILGIILIIGAIFTGAILSFIEWIFTDSKTIKCPNCKKINKRAKGWDYQRCNCGEYLYDYR